MAFFPANFMLQTSNNEYDNNSTNNQPPNSLSPILPPCPPQDFHGVPSFLGKRSMSFSGIDNFCEDANGDDDLSDDGSQAGERKRRLNMEQVKTLEKNFELGNKLEPERKMQLARALGLQPRQIAIWFQNRRARWKTKQLEKDYDVLKRQFEAIKAENDSLQSQNLKLQAEILALKNGEPTESINLNKETIEQGSCSNRSENSSDIQLDLSRTSAIDSPLSTHPTSIPLFPTSSSSVRSSGMTAQLFQNQSSRPEFHAQKMDHQQHHHHPVKEESFCNMFCGIEDQSGLWPWLEQHTQFN